MVEWMFAWVTVGLTAPGVRARLGRIAPEAVTTMAPVVRTAGLRLAVGRGVFTTRALSDATALGTGPVADCSLDSPAAVLPRGFGFAVELPMVPITNSATRPQISQFHPDLRVGCVFSNRAARSGKGVGGGPFDPGGCQDGGG